MFVHRFPLVSLFCGSLVIHRKFKIFSKMPFPRSAPRPETTAPIAPSTDCFLQVYCLSSPGIFSSPIKQWTWSDDFNLCRPPFPSRELLNISRPNVKTELTHGTRLGQIKVGRVMQGLISKTFCHKIWCKSKLCV